MWLRLAAVAVAVQLALIFAIKTGLAGWILSAIPLILK